MHPFKRIFIVSAGVLLGLGIGFFGADLIGERERSRPDESPSGTGGESPSSAAGSSAQAALSDTPIKAMSFEEKLAEIEDLRKTSSMRDYARTLDLIASLSEAELEAVLGHLENQVQRGIQGHLIPLYVFTAWLNKNPEGAHGYLLSKGNAVLDRSQIALLYATWGLTDPDAALAAVREMEGNAMRDEAFSGLVMAIARKDPERAFDLLNSLEDQSPEQFETIFGFWAKQNPSEAMAAATAMAPGRHRTSAIGSVLQEIAAKDIEHALRLANSLDHQEARKQALTTVTGIWMKEDMEGAMGYLSQMENGALKNEIVRNSLKEIVRVNPGRAFEFVHVNMTGAARDVAYGDVIRPVAKEQPEEAARMIKELPNGRGYIISARVLGQEWRKHDPVAALEWANSLGQSPDEQAIVSGIIGSFAYQNPAEAKAYLKVMPAGEQRERLAYHIAGGMTNDSPQDALAWANSLEDENLRWEAKRSAIHRWIHSDPQAAADYIRSKGSDSVLGRNSLGESLGKQWAKIDAKNAAAWALSLDGKAKEEAVEGVSMEWLQQDTHEASIWINKLEPGPARDKAVVNLVRKMEYSEPDSAFAWATTISEFYERSRRTEIIIVKMQVDGQAEEARKLIKKSDLSKAEKDSLLSDLDQLSSD